MTENGKIFVTELTVNNCPRKLRNSSIMKTSNISQDSRLSMLTATLAI